MLRHRCVVVVVECVAAVIVAVFAGRTPPRARPPGAPCRPLRRLVFLRVPVHRFPGDLPSVRPARLLTTSAGNASRRTTVSSSADVTAAFTPDSSATVLHSIMVFLAPTVLAPLLSAIRSAAALQVQLSCLVTHSFPSDMDTLTTVTDTIPDILPRRQTTIHSKALLLIPATNSSSPLRSSVLAMRLTTSV